MSEWVGPQYATIEGTMSLMREGRVGESGGWSDMREISILKVHYILA